MKLLPHSAFLVLLALLAVNVQAHTRHDAGAVKVSHYKYTGDTPKAKKVRVINPFGSITSRNTSYDEVELSGIIQKIGEQPAIHDIDIRDNNGVMEIEIRYPDGNRNNLGELTGRFDIGVWVPQWVTVEMITDFGDIKVKKSASNITARSKSGKMSIGTAGWVNAHSDSGNIKVDFLSERFQGPMQVSSGSGDVRVNLSKSARLALKAISQQTISGNLESFARTKRSGAALSAWLGEQTQSMPTLNLAADEGRLTIHVAPKLSHNIKSKPPRFLLNSSKKQQQTSNASVQSVP